MQVKAIRRQRNYYALFLTLSTFLAGWLGVAAKTEAAIAFGAVGVASLVLLIKKSRLLYDAALIWDNRILAAPSAFISATGGRVPNDTDGTVVSTFGILIGTKIYRWGRDGVHGVRLSAIEIDEERMVLTFGDASETMRVELLHGMTEQKAILDVKQKLWHETGIAASISGW